MGGRRVIIIAGSRGREPKGFLGKIWEPEGRFGKIRGITTPPPPPLRILFYQGASLFSYPFWSSREFVFLSSCAKSYINVAVVIFLSVVVLVSSNFWYIIPSRNLFHTRPKNSQAPTNHWWNMLQKTKK